MLSELPRWYFLQAPDADPDDDASWDVFDEAFINKLEDARSKQKVQVQLRNFGPEQQTWVVRFDGDKMFLFPAGEKGYKLAVKRCAMPDGTPSTLAAASQVQPSVAAAAAGTSSPPQMHAPRPSQLLSQIPNWLVVVDGSSRKGVGGVGAYLLCSYSEAKSVVLHAKKEYERLRDRQQEAVKAARDIVKKWVEENHLMVSIPPERACTSEYTGSTDMEVKTAVAALQDLLQRTQEPGVVILGTDCLTQTTQIGADGSGQDGLTKAHQQQLDDVVEKLKSVGGSLITKKIEGHGSTENRMEVCFLEGDDLLGDWEGLVFFVVDMAARKALRDM